MAKINWQDIGELTQVDQSGISKAIVIPAKEALRQVRFALTGNLTLRDNQYAAVVTLGYTGNSTQTLTSGVEYTLQNPLKTTPIGFTPIKAVDANGLALNVSGFDFNTARTDGLLGFTPWMFSTTGYVGEKVRAFTPFASRVSLTTSTSTYNVASVMAFPGEWDLSMTIEYGDTASTGTQLLAGISLTSATMPGAGNAGDNRVNTPTMPTAASGVSMAIAAYAVSPTVSTTYYQVAAATFSANFPKAWGRISGTRTSLVNNSITGLVTGILWGG